jgi:hypothetical protein
MPIDSGQVKEINLGDRKNILKLSSLKALNQTQIHLKHPSKSLCFALKGPLVQKQGSNPNLVSRVCKGVL